MPINTINIREAFDSDLEDVLFVERKAFGFDKEAELVRELLTDPSAKPAVSLLAFDNERPVGHILFTRAWLEGAPDGVLISLLAPLAIVPDAQKQGVGGNLIKEGLRHLTQAGVELVFVLGHPGYYPRFGFKPAGKLGLEAPYPIPPEHAEAWMVQSLPPAVVGAVKGKVICANALDKPEHWRE